VAGSGNRLRCAEVIEGVKSPVEIKREKRRRRLMDEGWGRGLSPDYEMAWLVAYPERLRGVSGSEHKHLRMAASCSA
jgi:hypothetical protein